MSARDPFVQSSEAQAFFSVIAALVILSQIIGILPSKTKGRLALWGFAVFPLLPYLANLIAIRGAQVSTLPSRTHEHPVDVLIRGARADFEHRLQHQSQNYSAAYQEYRRRYVVEPPPGFEAWYRFAAASQSAIIDNFDTIYDNISPFWRADGKEIRQVMGELQKDPNLDLWRCTFSSRNGETRCHHHYRTFDRHIELLFNRLLSGLGDVLPDVTFLVNHLDEPRVIVPPSQANIFSQGRLYEATELSRQPSWDAITKYCASDSNLQHKMSSPPEDTAKMVGLPFERNRSSALDLCQHPEYREMHGLFQSPTSLRLVEGLAPILSTGAPSTMGDFLIPSPAYMASEFQYDEAHDVEWHQKRNALYWAGSTTGGVALDGRWPNYHRQRFVTLAQNLGTGQQHAYLREYEGVVRRTSSSFLNGRLFDVAFTRIFQCERPYCRAQRMFFCTKAWADRDEALRSRLVFDLDGNGISGRYYKLLASRSAPLKQTLLREWHDDRLVPWVHYIPISPGMGEVPELVSYLTLTESGERRGKEIADQGREWFSTVFRDVDLTVYLYRLLLELARLQDPGRQALI